MNISIRRRIYLSFFLLVFLFVVNAIITVNTLNSNKELSTRLSEVVNPSLQSMDDFKKMMLESKMYATNWVFLRYKQEDKDLLIKLHDSDYNTLKARTGIYSSQWVNKNNIENLNNIFSGFEQLLVVEKSIMQSLRKFEDYNDPVIKLEAERKIEEEVLPRTAALMDSLNNLIAMGQDIQRKENDKLEAASAKLRTFIVILAITIIGIGIFLSVYMTSVIIGPVNKIRHIINDLGKGVIRKTNHRANGDEMGQMVHSVNNLSEKLQATATFAHEVGIRNFDMPFQPVSNEDTLGKALLIMRDNLKTSEGRLLDANAEIKTIYNAAPDAVVIIDEEGKIVKWDHKAETLFGWKESEVIGRSLTETIIPVRYHEAHNKGIRHFLKTGERHIAGTTIEVPALNKKNLEFDISLSISPSFIKNKYRFIGFIRDITARKKGEEEIKRFNERFQRLSTATDDAIWDWDLITDEVWWNDNFYNLMEYDSKKGVPGLYDWTKKIHPDDRDKVISRLRRVRKNIVNFWEDEFRYQLAGDTYGTLLDRAYVLRDDDGKPIRVIGALVNITERKKTEQQIADSERRYRQIVETAQEGIWLIDENNYTVFVNKKMCEMLEYSQEEILGKQYSCFKEEQKNIAGETENRKNEISENNDAVYITKSGKRLWANVSTNPIFNEDGTYKGVLSMVTDITQRKLHEELIRKSEASLETQNKELERKNKELEQFAYVASHDLQEPLRTTSSFVELFQQQYKGRLDETADKYLSYIAEASERMKVFITDLLEYSRIGSKKELKQVDCNTVLNEVLADLDAAIQETGAEIKADSLPVICGYPTEIKQLFQNLAFNAIKFRKKNIPPRIKISAHRERDSWQFSFADNGIGIAKEHNERIFIIFQRLHTRNEYSGSGIGLSHCKKIVELHKGKIWLESEPGQGSTFYFTIPQNNR